MKKLKLNLEALDVESFVSAPVQPQKGTVIGQESGYTDETFEFTQIHYNTCWPSCGQTNLYTACDGKICI